MIDHRGPFFAQNDKGNGIYRLLVLILGIAFDSGRTSLKRLIEWD